MGIKREFGTFRGMIRLLLSYAQIPSVEQASLDGVERLVFVCRGNICRSAFADALTSSFGFPSASFGLRTANGRHAHDPVIIEAARRGIDISRHRSVAVEDFKPLAGDLYLVMEVRQLRELRNIDAYANARIDMLGRYGGRPHLHDPYGLGEEFTKTSLADINRSVTALISAVRDANRKG